MFKFSHYFKYLTSYNMYLFIGKNSLTTRKVQQLNWADSPTNHNVYIRDRARTELMTTVSVVKCLNLLRHTYRMSEPK